MRGVLGLQGRREVLQGRNGQRQILEGATGSYCSGLHPPKRKGPPPPHSATTGATPCPQQSLFPYLGNEDSNSTLPPAVAEGHE